MAFSQVRYQGMLIANAISEMTISPNRITAATVRVFRLKFADRICFVFAKIKFLVCFCRRDFPVIEIYTQGEVFSTCLQNLLHDSGC